MSNRERHLSLFKLVQEFDKELMPNHWILDRDALTKVHMQLISHELTKERSRELVYEYLDLISCASLVDSNITQWLFSMLFEVEVFYKQHMDLSFIKNLVFVEFTLLSKATTVNQSKQSDESGSTNTIDDFDAENASMLKTSSVRWHLFHLFLQYQYKYKDYTCLSDMFEVIIRQLVKVLDTNYSTILHFLLTFLTNIESAKLWNSSTLEVCLNTRFGNYTFYEIVGMCIEKVSNSSHACKDHLSKVKYTFERMLIENLSVLTRSAVPIRSAEQVDSYKRYFGFLKRYIPVIKDINTLKRIRTLLGHNYIASCLIKTQDTGIDSYITKHLHILNTLIV
jgi:hypothetical protein